MRGERRFDADERLTHWGYAAFFLVLIGTGALMLWGAPSWRAVAVGPYRLLPLVHELAGAALLLTPILSGLLGRGASLARALAEWISWKRSDRFNVGQRVNALFTIASLVVLGATGILIWLGRQVPYWIQEPAYELHVLVAILGVLVLLGHVVMALAHPSAMRAMVRGRG